MGGPGAVSMAQVLRAASQLAQQARLGVLSGSIVRRPVASTTGDAGSPGEAHLLRVLSDGISVHHASVKDISGGCGSMYEIYVASDDFKGMSLVKQHKKVKAVLAADIKDMHGL